MKLLDKLTLKSKLLFLGILPAVTLAVILAAYFTSTRLNDTRDLLHKTNQNLASSIAESSINALYSGNIDELKSILNAFSSAPDIISIKVTTPVGNALAKVDNKSVITGSTNKIFQPIKLKTLAQFGELDGLFVGDTNQQEKLIGYISLTHSYESMQEREQDILLNSLLITLSVLFLIAFAAKLISTAIGRPILQLAEDVSSISQGNYALSTENTENTGHDEVAVLSKGIHEMALKINSHQNELQSKVHDATQELRLQNEKLFNAQEKIIKTAEAKSRFISHISHEIRTPLNGIIGFLEIIQQTPLSDEQKKLINASYLSSKNLHLIINEVLDFTRLDAGKVSINKTNFHVQQSVQDALLLLSTQAKNNNVRLNYSHDTKLPDVIHQDAVKFGQILINLIGNAIKFSPNSSVTISITTEQAEKNTLIVSVSDHGKGISKEDIEQLFKEFSQFGSSENEGTGLGLAITKNILEIMGGTINVESVLGEGSTFSFTLPFTQAEYESDSLAKTAAADLTLPDLSGIKVLVADDNEINRLLLTNLLERQGADISCVNDGQAAIDKASSNSFDLMLLDLRMPLKMGNEALAEIRNQPENPNYNTPAIAITAHITSGEERAHHISSFDGYLIKPIDQARFFSLVEQLLNEHDHDSQPFVSIKENKEHKKAPKAFDYNLAKETMNTGPNLIYIMLTKFFAELPSQHSDITNLLEQGKLIEAAEVVHKIHGSAAYCGTPLLKTASKQLEIALRSNDAEKASGAHNLFVKNIEEILFLENDILASIKQHS